MANFVWNDNEKADGIDKYWGEDGEQNHRIIISEIINKYIEPGSVVLDAGCGSGEVYKYLKPYLSEKEAFYFGIDGSIPFLNKCRERYNEDCILTENKDWLHHKKVRFELQNLFETVFSDNCFDLVICIDVVQHVQYYENILKEIFRITKNKLILRTWVQKADVIDFDGEVYNNYYNQSKLFDFCNSLSQGKIKTLESGLYVLSK